MILSRINAIIVCLALSACSANKHNSSLTLQNKLDSTIEKNYQIKNGHLIFLYSLHKHNNDSLYSKNYDLIINDKSYNEKSLQQFQKHYSKIKTTKLLAERMVKQIDKLKKLLHSLNQDYHFLPRIAFHRSETISHSESDVFSNLNETKYKISLNKLSELDHIAKNLPLFTPLHSPTVTSHYGVRKHPITKKISLHTGIDLVGRKLCDIYSTGNGKVKLISRTNSYGNMVEISHLHGFSSRYAHLNKIYVREGEKVIRGQKIGLQGKTGSATNDHLHYEILFQNKPVNPKHFF